MDKLKQKNNKEEDTEKESESQSESKNKSQSQSKNNWRVQVHLSHHPFQPPRTRSLNPSLLLLIIITTILSLVVVLVFYPPSTHYHRPGSRSTHLTSHQPQIPVDDPNHLLIHSLESPIDDRSSNFIPPSSSPLPQSTAELSQVLNLTIIPSINNTSITPPAHQRQLIHPSSPQSSLLKPSPAPYSYHDSLGHHQSLIQATLIDPPHHHSILQRPLARLHRRDQNYPSPTWPGTDTVYATKTIFVSQASPTMTVYVSNGQIIYPSLPTPIPNHPTIGNYPPGVVFVSPSGNPNIVVATITAMSSAKRFDWDRFDSSSWTVLIFIHGSTYLFMILGFSFVGLGL